MKHQKKCSSARTVLKSTAWAVILTLLTSTVGSVYATPEPSLEEEKSRQRTHAAAKAPQAMGRSVRKQYHRELWEQRQSAGYRNIDGATLCAFCASSMLLILMSIYATVLS